MPYLTEHAIGEPLTYDLKQLESVLELDYNKVNSECEAAGAILAYLWWTAKAAAEVKDVDISDTMLGQTVTGEITS